MHKPCKQINCRQHDQQQQQQQQQQPTSHKQYHQEWMAVWNNYHCDYMDFTDQQLSQCFQTLKIASIDTRGASISGFMKKYFLTRLANVTMYSPAQNNNDPEAKYVWVKTLHWPHLLWHQSMDAWEATLQKEKRKAHEIVFWITPFFISSERETYLHLGRAMQFMDVAEQVLTPKRISNDQSF
ncbi:NB-ARC domain [Seminavis robusta]|uniref:NB-ARC domain n=1 Tax=Seminavis robusta TaxID=568900 RepID=A0A9N8F1Z3_9STRA|nr:NB-ARC domain [Seminavis robusta]|eukprot:Sro2894_g339640.1 NB-ARC domain (183) ;mRNA; f:7074-7622